MEAFLEVAVSQRHDAIFALALLIRCEQPPRSRSHAEHGEQVGGCEAHGNVFRMIEAAFAYAHFAECRHVRERGILPLPLQIIPPRHLYAPTRWIGHIRDAFPHENQPLRIGIRQRLQNNGMDHAEDSDICANPQRQNSDACQCVARTPAEQAQGIT